ncbi:carboxypeptidase Y [Coccidioides immitis RMSCC 3703]|uniref:Carboxypeptidase n=1 Tax=Coccidioides immitis RMSCC 3703 TaxID=454286 RepID=A0A0J8R4L4_COCIT|nr:carboxypeptidase Y [Coccidioides immitis RMSCC 3703]
MKALTATLFVGTALAAVPPQQPIQVPTEDSAWAKPLENLKDTFKTLGNDAKQAWNELASAFPDAINEYTLFSAPKKHTRRPDTHWDHIVRGSDVQSIWVEGADGQKRREVDGKLEKYDLRVKAVDPSKLGIDKVKQYSGYLDDKENDKHLFYWFFESRNDPKNDPVVLWLNGDPGCSSLTGLFLELGPASIDKNLKVVHNPYSWNSNASVIFLDQPVNVGFSYSGGSVSDTIAAGKDVYALLTLFFKQFPQYATQDFHIAGESYAGHYIPVFASEILSHKNRNINLQSVLIGNGLTDPLTQYPHYRPMACGEGGYPAVLDESTCRSMDNSLPRCLSMIESCYSSESVWLCVPASIYCNNAMIGPYQRTGQNPYDVRAKCEDGGSLCYSQLGYITEGLNQKSVMDALGVEVSSYDSCNMDINRNFLFHGDWMKPFHRVVPGLIDQIRVLIYAGDADFICNWLGNQAWTDALEWSGREKFAKAELKDLTIVDNENKGKNIGKVKSYGNFTFMRLFGGGHMVPLDQPEASLEFFNRWLGGEW